MRATVREIEGRRWAARGDYRIELVRYDGGRVDRTLCLEDDCGAWNLFDPDGFRGTVCGERIDEASLPAGPLRDALLTLAFEHQAGVDRAEDAREDFVNQGEGGDDADIRANR